MTTESCCARTLCALLLALAAIDAHAGCAQMPGLRNQTMSARGPAEFQSRSGKFTFELPLAEQRVEMGSFGNRCFYAINIDGRGGEHFSIEWVDLDDPLDDAGFVGYWRGFVSDYLGENFGTGHYDLVAVEDFVDPQGRPSLRYAGTGRNHGGGEGSIVGVVTLLRTHRAASWVNTYTILSREIDAGADPFTGAEAEAVVRLSRSIDCSESVCLPAPAPEGAR